jgi:hypothetical protein
LGQALDKALMKFHNTKMEEINKIIQELWQQVLCISPKSRHSKLKN